MSLYDCLTSMTSTRKEKSLPGRNPVSDAKCGMYIHRGMPRCLRLRAGFGLPAVFTLEAAVILPLLAAFFVSILFFFRVMQVQIEVQKALDDTGRKLAVCLSGDQANRTMELGTAKVLFLKEMAGREEAGRYISGGSIGVSLISSEFTEDEIHLKADYHITLPVRIFRVCDLAMEQRADCRKWTGWNDGGGSGTGDEWVYITETGSVYHTKSTCTHLELSIQSVDYSQIDGLRNENGTKYRECTQCMHRAESNTYGHVYITNQGDCYHTDLGCSGIKRTVRMVRLSEVGDRRACSRCGD